MTVLVDAHVRRVDAFGNTFDDVEVNGQFLKSDGLFNIDSTKIAGKIAFNVITAMMRLKCPLI